MKIFLKIFLSITFLCLSGYGLFLFYKNDIFKITSIKYHYDESNPYLEFQHSKVEDVLEGVEGKLIWEVDIFELQEKIKSLSWIQEARISKQYPSQIEIHIFPRKIIANLLRTSNKIQPISEESKVLEVADISKAPDAPILAHKSFLKDDELRAQALQLLKELPSDGSFSQKNVSEVYPSGKNSSNLNFQIFLKHSHALVLMDTENVPLKAARVARVIDYMGPEELKSRIIDANFSKKVLVKPRNHR